MSKNFYTIFFKASCFLAGMLTLVSFHLPEDGGEDLLLPIIQIEADGTRVARNPFLPPTLSEGMRVADLACMLSITQVSVGTCKNDASTSGIPTTLVAVQVEWFDEPVGEVIQVNFDGDMLTIDPSDAGCPAYALFEVNLNTATSSGSVTAQFSGGTCLATPVPYSLPSPCTTADPCGVAGTIGGNVFLDFDSDGNSDASELGLADIEVTVYDCDQALLCTTNTDQNGDWTCSGLPDGTDVRVEYNGLPSDHYSGQTGVDNKEGSVQFGTVGTDCNLEYGVLPIDDFCEDDPYVITPCYVRGDVLAPGSAAGAFDVLVAIPYSASGTVSQNVYLAEGAEMGSTWGIAINKATRHVFASSVLKRHSGWGPDSLGAIYKVDVSTLPPASPTGNTSLYVDLDADFGIETANEYQIIRDLDPDVDVPSYDSTAFDLIGKVGLGDIDISPDADSLFAINLFSKAVVVIRNDSLTDTPISAVQVPIPDPGCSSANDWRPWALKYYEGRVLVGGVCSAQTSQNDADLTATIYEFNPQTASFTELVSFPLDYPKGSPASFLGSPSADCQNWNPWTDSFLDVIESGAELCYPQPILSDIEVDVYGNLSVGFIDRMGHQVGWYDYGISASQTGTTVYKGNVGGEILRLYNNNGTFLLEQNATAGYDTGCGAGNNQGPCGGEFYCQDSFGGSHQETAHGGVAIHPSNNEILLNVMDPIGAFSAGLAWYNNTTGVSTRQYQIYFSGNNGNTGLFGKAAGLGDLELTCSMPFQEIGNYLWVDENENDIQDGCDTYIAGANVSLYETDGTLVITKMTDAAGHFAFTTADGLEPETDYYVVIGTSGQFADNRLTIGAQSYSLVGADVGAGPNPDQNDSDAVIADGTYPVGIQGLPVIAAATGRRGESLHRYDAGFVALPPCEMNDVTILTECDDNGTPGDPSDDTFTYTVNVDGSGTTIAISGDDTQTGLTYATTEGSFGPFNIADGDLTITLVDEGDGSCTLIDEVVVAPATCSSCANLDAGMDAAICAGETYTTAGSSVGGTGNIVWVSNGDGSFDDENSLTATYTPGANDLLAGTVVLTLAEDGVVGCTSLNQSMTLSINDLPTVNSGVSTEACEDTPGSGTTTFTLTDLDDQVDAAGTNTVTYHENLIDAQSNLNALSASILSGDSTLYVRVEDPLTDCYATTTVDLIVHDQWQASLQNGTVCSENSPYSPSPDNRIDLFSLLTSGANTGTWSATDPTANAAINVDGVFTANLGMEGNTYTLVYTLTGGPGPDGTPCDENSFTTSLTVEDCFASLGDTLWLDRNANGAQEAGEPGVAGADVVLYECSGGIKGDSLNVTQTNGAGFYQFVLLPPGEYCVDFRPETANQANADQLRFTLANAAGVDETQDSDALGTSPNDPLWGCTESVILAAGDEYEDLDAGVYIPAKLGDYVWEDIDGDGIQDADEPGIEGVTVTLTATDNQGQAVNLQTSTDGTGMYMFGDLVPGDYSVSFTPPTGMVVTALDDLAENGLGDDSDDSDADPDNGHQTTTYALNSGDTVLVLDAGFLTLGKMGDLVWEDLNGNGIQNADEPGIPGQNVRLFGEDNLGRSISEVSITDANGMYMFGDLWPGAYKISFEMPEGMVVTATNDPLEFGLGDDTDDNDADLDANLMTEIYDLFSADTILLLDGGFLTLGKIGDLAWEDYNANGIQDAGEPGLAEVVVELQGLDNLGNAVEAILTTDNDGMYMFGDLWPGTYKTTFTLEAPYFTTLLDDPQGNGLGDDSDDSDANPETGMTSNYDLLSGDTILLLDAGAFLLDFGDLPLGFPTELLEEGARHTVIPGKYLGDCVDAEDNGNPDTIAGGDNSNAGAGSCGVAGSDESGVRILTPLIPGAEACLEITTNLNDGLAYLAIWIDFDGDGSFDGDANEQVVFHRVDGNPVANLDELTINAGTQIAEYCFTVPTAATFEGGETHMRVRYACEPGLSYQGLAIGGEVEDYYLQFARVGNYAWLDEDLEGDQNEGVDLGLNGVELTLQYAGEDQILNTFDDRYYTTTTTNLEGLDGVYGFSGLIPGQYHIRPAYPTGYILAIDNLPASDFLDSDGNESFYFLIPDPVNTLVLGENGTGDAPGTLDAYPDEQDDLSLDLGFIEEPSMAAALTIVGVDFASSGTCGQLDVLLEACVTNNGEIPLENLVASLDLASQNALGDAFLEVVSGGEWAVISSTAQTTPDLNGSYNGKSNTSVFTPNSGLLYPGETVCLSLRIELDPDHVNAPAFPKMQLSVQGGAVNYSGIPIPDYILGTPQYVTGDLSDTGDDPAGLNPGEPGDTGGADDPTLLTDCWAEGETLAANDGVQISLSGDCSALITSDMILEGADESCDEDDYPQGGYYVVTVMNAQGNVLSNPIPGDYLGEELTIKVQHVFSCNEVWSTVTLEDKLAPVFDCPQPPVLASCSDDLAAIAPPVATDNCSDITYHLIDEYYEDNNICDDQTIELVRMWLAIDPFGNESQACMQTILISRPTEIDFPDDQNWTCAEYDAYPGIVEANLYTGVLSTTGAGIPNEGAISADACNYILSHSDQIIEGCGATFDILRTWTVLDWCTGTVITSNQMGEDNVQNISIEDGSAPVINLDDYTVQANVPGAHPDICRSTQALDLPYITDDCSEWTLRIFTPIGEADYVNGQNAAVGASIPEPGLPLGTHQILYEVTDACNQVSELVITLTVIDEIAPTAICDEITNVTLSSDGLAIVNASVFDDGSFDNCCLDLMEVRRMDGDCDGFYDDFGESVTFCCEDVDNGPITVVFRVSDCFGQTNECMVTVEVEDKLPVTGSCLANQTISCETYVSDLAASLALEDLSVLEAFGAPEFYDNCSYEVNYQIAVDLDACQQGTITRSWTAQDPSQNVPFTCTQTIFVEHASNWVVEFPENKTIDCTAGELPEFGEPNIYFDECEMIGISFEDQYFYVVPDACYKIIRTWTAINWCLYDQYGADLYTEQGFAECDLNLDLDLDGDKDCRTFQDGQNGASTPDGFIRYQQVLKVVDELGPQFELEDESFCITSNSCEREVILEIPTYQDCSTDLTIEIETDLPGATSNPYVYEQVPLGEYQATYKVSDECGNTTYQEKAISVVDCKKPTPYCANGLIVEIMQTGMIEVWAIDLNQGSFDNCPGDLIYSFSEDITETSRVFTCEDLGVQTVQMWVTDASGNQDYCETSIQIQDNMGACISNANVAIGGAIQTENNVPIPEVSLDTNGGSMQTDFNGNYLIQVPSGSDYTVVPALDTDPLNGVTTYDLVLITSHILGIQPLSTPYQRIAADANNSGAITTLDVLAIRKVILLADDEFQNNTSWRFVEKDYVFPDPTNPWSEPFPEVVNYNNLTTNQLNTDFIGVKIGDVNGSVQPLAQADTEQRTLQPWSLFVKDQVVAAGEELILELQPDLPAVAGMQFSLQVDPEYFEILEVMPGVAEVEHLGMQDLGVGMVHVSWNDMILHYFKPEDNLLTLRLQAKKSGQLAERLELVLDQVPAEAYGVGGELFRMEIQAISEPEFVGYYLMQNAPNPFDEVTVIRFQLPKGEEASLTVMDINGRVIWEHQQYFDAGIQRIELRNLGSPGVLFYQLETTSGWVARKKMILEK